MIIPIVGEIPQITLYRFFSENSHAESFVNKEIWFGWQKKYQNMESDIREDQTEGNAKYYVQVDNQTTVSFNTKTGEAYTTTQPGKMEVSSISLNHFYILCASEVTDEEQLKKLRKRFSKSKKKLPKYIKINNVELFTKKIQHHLEKSPYRDCIFDLQWHKVEYSKGQEKGRVDPELNIDVYQKPSCINGKDFACEQEWRLVISMKHEIAIRQKKNASVSSFL